ncbi:hypothetical protein Ancab_024576 [Ancistrocladus abbreviatus]
MAFSSASSSLSLPSSSLHPQISHVPGNRLHHHYHQRKPVSSLQNQPLSISSIVYSFSSHKKISTIKCLSRRQSTEQSPPSLPQQQQQQQEIYEIERLFSNLNQVTLKREPGSLSSAIFLVAGTTVGAGILAIPAVTQEAGFLASAVACIVCWVFMVVTGLLIAEVNINTMCELGSGGGSLVSMAKRTLGTTGVQFTCWSYIFIHYALLVAYVARSSDILTNYLHIPLWESATIFSLVFGGICYFGSQRFIGAVNGVLVLGIIISFISLVVVASGDLHWEALLKANFEAVPLSIPIIALSFVYQNVVPVLCTNLEGNPSKVRIAIVLGTAIPLVLFLVWNAVVLGTISNPDTGVEKIIDPLQQLRSSSGIVGPIVEGFSLLAIATSYIGFVLGLADFLADFLVLFGLVPAAMSWSDRYYSSSPEYRQLPLLVPGGKLVLSLVIGGAGWVIFSEILQNFTHS